MNTTGTNAGPELSGAVPPQEMVGDGDPAAALEAQSGGAALPKLNILALPSQTALIFALVSFVVVGAAGASLLPGSHLWAVPVLISLLLLPIHDFLQAPEQAKGALDLTWHGASETGPGEEDWPSEMVCAVEQALAGLAPPPQGAGSPPLPIIALARRPAQIQTLGTWRRRYLVLPRFTPARIVKGLGRSRDAEAIRGILAHELAHCLNRDLWIMGLAHSLARMMALAMLANLVIVLGVVLFTVEVGPEVLRPQFWEHLWGGITAALPGVPAIDWRSCLDALRSESPALFDQLADPARKTENWAWFLYYQISSLLPFIFSGAVLATVYWRGLRRVRELYADARAAALLGTGAWLEDALTQKDLLVMVPFRSKDRKQAPRLRLPLLVFAGRVQDGPGDSRPGRLARARAAIAAAFATHPSNKARLECLAHPEEALGSWWQIAGWAGLAVVLLDLVLRGSLTAPYIYEPGPHLPFMVAFLVFSVWLLPRVCLGASSRDLLRLALCLNGLFAAIKLLPHLFDGCLVAMILATNAAGWAQVIDFAVYAMSGASGILPPLLNVEMSWGQFLSLHVLRPALYFALVLPPVVSVFLWVEALLVRRALTWFSLGPRVKLVFAAITGLLAAVLALVVIPIFNRLIFPEIYTGWSTWELAGAGVTLLSLVVGLVAYWHYDGRLAGRCGEPGCNGRPSSSYRLGESCSCGAKRHDWLAAPY